MKTALIKNGIFVLLKTSIRGGIDYQRVDLESDHIAENGERVARWETRRAILAPQEYEAAVKARAEIRNAITRVCAATSFGLWAETAKESELDAAIDAAIAIQSAHNGASSMTRLDVFCIKARVASDDVEAARAIASDMRDLLDDMREGIANADPAKIREAANKARELGAMLSDDVAGKVSIAIEQARKAARDIVRRVEKAGEDAAVVITQIAVDKVEAARFAFLDLDAGNVEAFPQVAPSVEMAPAVEVAAPGAVVQREIEVAPELADIPVFLPSAAPAARAFEL